MAERRMFAKSIIDSDAFIDMPTSSRLLYYDLSMRADDDGFVNSPKKIVRMTGASDDDLKMLIAKSLLIPFESGVVVIKHWKIHNYIRGDRYTPTICQAEKECLSITDTKVYIKQNDIPMVDQVADNRVTQDRIGKGSLEKDRIGEDSVGEKQADCKQSNCPPIPFPDIQQYFNQYCTNLPSIREMTEERKKHIRAFLETHDIADLYHVFDAAQKSAFLSGKTGKDWKATFDWLIQPANAIKVLEGNYTDQTTKNPFVDAYYRMETEENDNYDPFGFEGGKNG